MAPHTHLVEILREHLHRPLAQAAALLIMEQLGDASSPLPQDVDEQLTDMCQGYRTTLIAVGEDEDVLAVGGVEINGNEGQLVDVITDPGHRRQGLGRKIVRGLERRARRERAKHIFAVALSGSEGFYEKLGYQPDSNGHYRKAL